MSTSTTNSLQVSLRKGILDSSPNQRLILGARFRIDQNFSAEMIQKRTSGSSKRNFNHVYELGIICNDGFRMRDCEATTTISIEVGKGDDVFYSKHDYDAVFKEDHQEETFKLKNGLIIRNYNVAAGAFDNSVFEDDFHFRVTVTVHSVNGPRILPPPTIDFRDPKSLHDVILSTDDGTKFHVQSQTLSSHSGFFLRIFRSDFAESKQAEIPISEVKARDFELLLRAIYPFPPEITWRSLDSLFILADRFDIPGLTQKCIDFLIRMDKSEAESYIFDLMYWADKYNLLELQSLAYKTLEEMDTLHSHIKDNADEFNQLPFSVRERFVNELKLRRDKE